MSSEVRLIPDWRERWEPVTTHTKPMQVLEVWEDKGGIAAIVNNDGRVFVCYGYLTNIPQPKKLRPWRREEVPVGSVVRNRDGNIRLITGADEVGVWINGCKLTYAEILGHHFIHATSPDGTWIPTEQCPKCGVEE